MKMDDFDTDTLNLDLPWLTNRNSEFRFQSNIVLIVTRGEG